MRRAGLPSCVRNIDDNIAMRASACKRSLTRIVVSCSTQSDEEHVMMRQVATFVARRVVVCAGMMVWTSGAVAQPAGPAALPLRIVPGLEEPLVPMRATSADEDGALDTAIAAFRVVAALAPADPALHLRPLVHFAMTQPRSGWRTAVLANLGFAYHRTGYTSRALDCWRAAWQDGRAASDPRAVALIDKVAGALARTLARLGRADELDRLLRELANRPLRGPATEAVTEAREHAWRMRSDPAPASLDGPTALKNLLLARGARADAVAFLDNERAGRRGSSRNRRIDRRGFSLAQLSGLASRAGLRHRLVHRAPGQAVPVPSVVHWSVRHYAAIVGERDGGYLLEDPTLGAGTAERWIARDALDRDATGFFLVPADVPQDPAWRAAKRAEAERIRGAGFTAIRPDGATTLDDPAIYPRGFTTNPPTAAAFDGDPSVGTGTGVATYNAHPLLASLHLQITASGYPSLKGPPAHVRLLYNQREAHQPANFGFFNVGPKWTLNVLSFIEDNPAVAGVGVVRHAPGGGAVHYPTSGGPYSAATGAFAPEPRTQAVLVRIPATGRVASYELRMPDGGKHVFARFDTATTAPRRVFLTRIVDPAGNALTLHYDDELRLRTLVDTAGRTTRFGYGQPDHPLRVTLITDPFGRSSILHYLACGQLGSSTDATATTSSFTYDDAGLIDTMTTSYGTTSFRHGLDAASARFLEIVDPMGFAERIEAFGDEPERSLYWDRHVLALARATPGAIDARARRTPWRAAPAPSPAPSLAPTEPSAGVRYTYNAAGQIVSATDADNKVTRYTYDSVGSLTAVVDPSGTTVLALAYDAFDRVATTRDASGRVLRYTYDELDRLTRTIYPDDTFEQYVYDRRDLVAVIDRRAQVTSYAYDANRRRTSVTDPLGRVTRYDYYDNGVLKALAEPSGSVTTWDVDLQSRPTRHEPAIRPPAVPLAGAIQPIAATGSTHPRPAAPPIARHFDRTRGIICVVVLALLTVLSVLVLRAMLRNMHARGAAR
jgi:YD repeat-containing protein